MIIRMLWVTMGMCVRFVAPSLTSAHPRLTSESQRTGQGRAIPNVPITIAV